MLIEATNLINLPVVDQNLVKLASIKQLIFSPKEVRLIAVKVYSRSLLGSHQFIPIEEMLEINRSQIVIKSAQALMKTSKEYEDSYKVTGPIIGVKAKTESGRSLGLVSDLLLDGDTGLVVRFYLKKVMKERIIPREYLVILSPREIIFRDVVDQPIFDSVVLAEKPT